MAIKIRNQRPAVLYNEPFNMLPLIDPTKDMQTYLDETKTHITQNYIEPMYQPINQNAPVEIEETPSNTKIDQDTLQDAVLSLWTNPVMDTNLQEQISELYRQGIQYHTQNDWYFEEQLGVEAITRSKLPLPSDKGTRIVKYSASTDVIPAAKNFLAQNDDVNATNWFANMKAYTYNRPFTNYLLVTVQSESVFDDIKQQLKAFVASWNTKHIINKDTNKLLGDFDKISLKNDLSATIFLPHNGGGSTQEQQSVSFTRMLMYVLSQYEKNGQNMLTVQPNNLAQVYFPENIIIMNLENYAHAKASDVKADWDIIEKALHAKKQLNFVSTKKLMTAKAVNAFDGSGNKNNSFTKKEVGRHVMKKFSGKPVPAKEMMLRMKKVIESQTTSKVTQNTYKAQKTSYMRPNRRKPDDINLPGKLTTTMYRPDIHIYLDTSGSISESQYRDSITNLIILAKKIDCNLYFTSFSDHISQTALLKTKGKSTKAIYQAFQAVPKVSGGTDFMNVWRKIDMLDDYNKRNSLSHQINFMITDFGYDLSAGHRWDRDQAAVKNTYYVPISIDKRRWHIIENMAKDFLRDMTKAGDRGLRKRMLL